MLTTVRSLRIVLLALLTLLPPATALAQPIQGTDGDSPALMVILITFCLLVIGLLAYTARRMARLQ